MSLFPIDTLKTRLQAPGGFRQAGGFSGIYRGLGAAAAGSVPGAALFFTAYERTKHTLGAENTSAQVCAASVGETVACSVRVPVENVKQNQQAGKIDARLLSGASQILRESGVGGFYRGFGATVGREVPFAMIQMPLLESAKRAWRGYRGADLEPYHVALVRVRVRRLRCCGHYSVGRREDAADARGRRQGRGVRRRGGCVLARR